MQTPVKNSKNLTGSQIIAAGGGGSTSRPKSSYKKQHQKQYSMDFAQQQGVIGYFNNQQQQHDSYKSSIKVYNNVSVSKSSITNLQDICKQEQQPQGIKIYDYLYNKDTTIDQLLQRTQTQKEFFENSAGKKVTYPVKDYNKQSAERILTSEGFIKQVDDYEKMKERQKEFKKQLLKQSQMEQYRQIKNKENIVTGQNFKRNNSTGKNMVNNERSESPCMKLCIEQNLEFLKGKNIQYDPYNLKKKALQYHPQKKISYSQNSSEKEKFIFDVKNQEDQYGKSLKPAKRSDNNFQNTNDSKHLKQLIDNIQKNGFDNNNSSIYQSQQNSSKKSYSQQEYNQKQYRQQLASKKRNSSQDIQSIMNSSQLLQVNGSQQNLHSGELSMSSRGKQRSISNLHVQRKNNESNDTKQIFSHAVYQQQQ